MVLGAAAALFAAVFVWCETSGDTADAVGLLYVIPTALIALELGLIPGVLAAVGAWALTGLWVLTSHTGIGALGMATRGAAFLALGIVAGRFADHMRDAQSRQRGLLESGLALAHLTTAEDLPVNLARDACELLSAHGALVELGGRTSEYGSMLDAQECVPIEVRGVHYGTLSIAPARAISAEDRVTLAFLALQAAIAEENHRLLEQERQRAAMRAELHDARVRLEQRGRQLRELITKQEAERGHVAYELHENAAQVLAAVLLGLAALERELGVESAGPRLGALRSEIEATLRSLRALAVSLRPPSLSLGLKSALEGLAADISREGPGEMSVTLSGVDGLGADMETMVYRAVEEALDVASTPRALTLSRRRDRELEIVVQATSASIECERLVALRARLELMSGRVSATADALRVVIPLAEADAAVGAEARPASIPPR